MKRPSRDTLFLASAAAITGVLLLKKYLPNGRKASLLDGVKNSVGKVKERMIKAAKGSGIIEAIEEAKKETIASIESAKKEMIETLAKEI